MPTHKPAKRRIPRIPSPQEIEAARTPAGGWTKAQLAKWGVPWPPPSGWKKRFEMIHGRIQAARARRRKGLA